MKEKDFVHNLIKGRIAETIFEMMFRDTKKFTVLHFGYESTVPALAQYRNMVVMKKILDPVSKSPDFLLMTEDKKQVYLVEVKYRANTNKEELVDIATKIVKTWEKCYIFLISKDGFYFSPVHSIINKKGDIEQLPFSWINQQIQDKYRELAWDFLWRHKD